jgi:hypothetical protein
MQAATPDQKARVLGLLTKGVTLKDQRTAALRMLEMAAKRDELLPVLEAAAQKGSLKTLLSDMGDHSAGVSMARLLLAAKAYEKPTVWRVMDDDATRGLMKALGFKRPMIGSSETLAGLPEDARHRMIAQLTGGNMTTEEQDMAKWINLHNVNKVEIREYNNNF